MESRAELRKKCAREDIDQSTKKFHRFTGDYLMTKLFIMLKTPPNTITIFSIVSDLIAVGFLFFGEIWGILIGFLFLEFSYILDFADGCVARYWKKSTMNGLFLDQFEHQLSGRLVFFALSFGIFLHTGWLPVLIFGFIASTFSISIVNTAIYWAIIRKKQRLNKGNDTKEQFERTLKGKIDVGEVKGNTIYLIAQKLNRLWVQPYYFWVLGWVSVIEVLNLYIGFIQPYFVLTLYILVYGIVFTIIQVASFIINYKARSVDLQYQSLFSKDKIKKIVK